MLRVALIIFCTIPFQLLAQNGGGLGYQTLVFPNNARTAALGGSAISIGGGDLSQVLDNPALLDSVDAGTVFFNATPFFTDASVLSFGSALDAGKLGKIGIGVVSFNYGEFEQTSANGESLGRFSVQDYQVSLAKSHKLGPFVFGGTLKFLQSSIESYNSSAILADLGGLFTISPRWGVGLVFRNMGFRLNSFSNAQESLPFDVQLGTSFKPKYMPIRFTVTTLNLANANAGIEDEQEGRNNATIEKAFRRINLGAELLLSENFQLLVGYNHKRKQELRLDDLTAGAGLSFGLMLKIKKIEFRYARAAFHSAGGASFISLQTNIKAFNSIL